MNISVLASGSRGNCTLIYDDNNAILIDMGISTRKLKQALAQLHLNIEDLDAIFITHEHIDHIRGLKTLTKNYNVPIYSKTATLKQIAITQKFTDIINNDGKVEKVEDLGKKKLAYEVKKNKEGYYVVINFDANPNLISELERNYRIMDEVIKFITIKAE